MVHVRERRIRPNRIPTATHWHGVTSVHSVRYQCLPSPLAALFGVVARRDDSAHFRRQQPSAPHRKRRCRPHQIRGRPQGTRRSGCGESRGLKSGDREPKSGDCELRTQSNVVSRLCQLANSMVPHQQATVPMRPIPPCNFRSVASCGNSLKPQCRYVPSRHPKFSEQKRRGKWKSAIPEEFSQDIRNECADRHRPVPPRLEAVHSSVCDPTNARCA